MLNGVGQGGRYLVCKQKYCRTTLSSKTNLVLKVIFEFMRKLKIKIEVRIKFLGYTTK